MTGLSSHSTLWQSGSSLTKIAAQIISNGCEAHTLYNLNPDARPSIDTPLLPQDDG